MAFGDIVETVTESDGGGGEDPVSLSFSGALTAGNLIVIGIFTGDGPNSPGTGLAESIEHADAGQDDAVAIYHRTIVGGDGATWEIDTPIADQHDAVMLQVEGPFEASPLDQTGVTASANDLANIAVAAAGATSQDDELVVAVVGFRHIVGGAGANTATVASWSDSFVERGEIGDPVGNNAMKACALATKVLTVAGTPSTTATFSLTAGRGAAVLATFKKQAGGSAPVPTLRSRSELTRMLADDEDEGRFNELDVRNWW